jgi:hypothetical protein
MLIAYYIGPVGIAGKLIRLWRQSKITHVELVLSDHTAITSDATKDGVAIYDFNSNFKSGKIEDHSNWIYQSCRFSKEIEAKIKEFANNEQTCLYDWRGIIFSQIFNFGLQSSSRWFCSEIVTQMLKIAYPYTLGDLVPHKIAPDQLYEIIHERFEKSI